MPALSDFVVGYLRRLLDDAANFVPSPAPRGSQEQVRAWCRKHRNVDTVAEVSDLWAKEVTSLGAYLFLQDLGDEIRRDRPIATEDCPYFKLTRCEEFAHAALCWAVDAAEAE